MQEESGGGGVKFTDGLVRQSVEGAADSAVKFSGHQGRHSVMNAVKNTVTRRLLL